MLTEYLSAALRRAHYELTEDGRFFATIAPLKGLWADGATLEDCRSNLQDALEDWLFVSLRERLEIPPIDGVALIPNQDLERVEA